MINLNKTKKEDIKVRYTVDISQTKTILLSYIIFTIMGSLLHFTYKKSGNNFFVGLFTPINESVFEHLKLVIFPIIIFSIFFYFFTEKRFNNIFFISFISICIACFSVIFINYLGNIKLQFALLGVICLFLPMCAISYLKLRKLEEKQTSQQKMLQK